MPQLTWVIKVELALQGFGLLLWSEGAVEAVLAQDDHLLLAIVHLVLPQKLHDLSTDGRLQGEKRAVQTTGWGPVTELTVCVPSNGLCKEECKGYHHGWRSSGREDMSAEKEFRGPRSLFLPHSLIQITMLKYPQWWHGDEGSNLYFYFIKPSPKPQIKGDAILSFTPTLV